MVTVGNGSGALNLHGQLNVHLFSQFDTGTQMNRTQTDKGPKVCRTSWIYGLWGFMGISIDSIDFL